MICIKGKVDFESTDVCIAENCHKLSMELCALKMFLQEHKATMFFPILRCKEVSEWIHKD